MSFFLRTVVRHLLKTMVQFAPFRAYLYIFWIITSDQCVQLSNTKCFYRSISCLAMTLNRGTWNSYDSNSCESGSIGPFSIHGTQGLYVNFIFVLGYIQYEINLIDEAGFWCWCQLLNLIRGITTSLTNKVVSCFNSKYIVKYYICEEHFLWSFVYSVIYSQESTKVHLVVLIDMTWHE